MSGVTVSVGIFIGGTDDIAFIDTYSMWDRFVSVGFYQMEDLRFLDDLMPYASCFSSVHLPKDLEPEHFEEGSLIDDLMDRFKVNRFVIHPWSPKMDSIVRTTVERRKFQLNLETFDTNKMGVFELIERYGKLFRFSPYLGMCVDTSHLKPTLCSYDVMKLLNPYTKVIHYSANVMGQPHQHIFKSLELKKVMTQYVRLPLLKMEELVLEYDKKLRETHLMKHFYSLRDEITQARIKANRQVK